MKAMLCFGPRLLRIYVQKISIGQIYSWHAGEKCFRVILKTVLVLKAPCLYCKMKSLVPVHYISSQFLSIH